MAGTRYSKIVQVRILANERGVALHRGNSMSSTESLERLTKLAADCSRDGWDGYAATAVSAAAVANAARLIHALPKDLPSPDPGAEPDGCVTLEWYVSPSLFISVSVAPNGRLDYVAILGERKEPGTSAVADEFPSGIRRLVRQICSVESEPL